MLLVVICWRLENVAAGIWRLAGGSGAKPSAAKTALAEAWRRQHGLGNGVRFAGAAAAALLYIPRCGAGGSGMAALRKSLRQALGHHASRHIMAATAAVRLAAAWRRSWQPVQLLGGIRRSRQTAVA